MLWPPDHKFVNVGLGVVESDTCVSSFATGVTIYANETDTNDGTCTDAANAAPGTLQLRSERNGYGNGRVYLILVQGTGTDGVAGTDCTTVVVPHDQSAASIATVNAMASVAAAYCDANGQPPPGFVQVGVAPTVTQQCSHE